VGSDKVKFVFLMKFYNMTSQTFDQSQVI